VETPTKDTVEGGGKSDGLESGQMQIHADLRAVFRGRTDQAVMDILAATQVGKFPPK
jgi:hypothetical protein